MPPLSKGHPKTDAGPKPEEKSEPNPAEESESEVAEELEVLKRPKHVGKDAIPVEVLHGTYHEKTPDGTVRHKMGSVVWVTPAMRDSNPDLLGDVGTLRAVAASASLSPRAAAALQQADKLNKENERLREELTRLKSATK